MRYLFFLLCFLNFGTLFAMDEFLAVGKCNHPPVIDGNLNDAAWKSAVEVTNFIKFGTQGSAAKRMTRVYVTYDHNNLYLAFHCFEEALNPVLNKLHEFKKRVKNNDTTEIWRDDMVEFFLAPDINSPSSYFHFAMNANGAIYDARGEGGKAWNSNADCATKINMTESNSNETGASWCAEIAIPLTSLGISTPITGRKILANFCRVSQSAKEISSWTQTNGKFHDSNAFGTLEFRENVPNIRNISTLAMLKTGKNSLSCISDKPVKLELHAEFPDTKVHFTESGKGKITVPFNLDPENKAYQFKAQTDKDRTETFLRTGNLVFRPGKNYTVSLRAKTNYSWNSKNREYPFLYILQGKSYQTVDVEFPLNTKGEWRTFQTRFLNKDHTSGSLWGIKWTKRNIEGTIAIDDISIIDDETKENILDNGDFSSGSRNYNVFRKEGIVSGYGNGAESAAVTYLIFDTEGKLIARSAKFQVKLAVENKEISSRIVQRGSNGLIECSRFSLAAGSPERISFLLKSSIRNLLDTAELSVIVPEDIRLLPPSADTTAPAPMTMNENTVIRNGKMFREYHMAIDRRFINSNDAPFSTASLLSFFIVADTAKRGRIGNLEYRAIAGKSAETAAHILPLEILEPPQGYAPTSALPTILWVYADGPETASMNDFEKQLIFEKVKSSGFNMIPCNARTAQMCKAFGIRPFPMLPTPTLSGPYFPFASAFVRKYPEYAAVNAHGHKTQTIDPAILLQKNNPFLPFMEKVIARYLTTFPDELHVDYEFSFMPRTEQKLPSGNAVIGFSNRNLEIFRQKYHITEKLTPALIFENYADQWRQFRNGQNADTLGLYREIARKLKSKARVSVYSGYPPSSDQVYGIDWKQLAPQIDLCMAGYGGSTEQMFQEIQKPMFNSGILQMDHVDGSQMAATFTEMLCQSGSYMSFLYYTCDGRYFYNASKAATIAATCEPLFRNLLHTKHPSLTVDAATGKIRGDAITLREGDKTAVILINRSSLPTAFTLKTKDIEHLDGIQLSSKKLISQKKGIYTVTVAPFSPDAVLFGFTKKNTSPSEIPQVTAPLRKSDYPVFRWQADPAKLESFEVRVAATQAELTSVSPITVTLPYFQSIRKNINRLYCQVRAITPYGRKGIWSKPIAAQKPSAIIGYARNESYLGKAAQFGAWQFYAWGGGSQFADFFVDKKLFASGDTASLAIRNEFDVTQSYWCLTRHDRNVSACLPQVKPGEKYRCKAMIWNTGEGKAALSVYGLGSDTATKIQRQSRMITGNANWIPVEVEITIPQNVYYLNIMFTLSGGPGCARLSNLELTRLN